MLGAGVWFYSYLFHKLHSFYMLDNLLNMCYVEYSYATLNITHFIFMFSTNKHRLYRRCKNKQQCRHKKCTFVMYLDLDIWQLVSNPNSVHNNTECAETWLYKMFVIVKIWLLLNCTLCHFPAYLAQKIVFISVFSNFINIKVHFYKKISQGNFNKILLHIMLN